MLSRLRKAPNWLRTKMRLLIRRHAPGIHAHINKLVPYEKPPLQPAALIQRLQGNGLTVGNTAAAEAFIGGVNYFRFKVYLRPFLSSPTAKTFIPNSSLDDAKQIYQFDEELRQKIMSLGCTLENAVKHRLDYRVTQSTNDPFWYLRKDVYSEYPTKTLNMLRSSFFSSSSEFTTHYSKKYHSNKGTQYHLMPPFWMTSEFTTLGQLYWLTKSLDKSKFYDAQRSINALDLLAQDFDAYNIGVFVRWLEYFRSLRNLAAHHNRVWNRNLGEPPNIARHLKPKLAGTAQHNHRIYRHLVMLRVMTRATNAVDGLAAFLKSAFAAYPAVDKLKGDMGFPASWISDPFWH